MSQNRKQYEIPEPIRTRPVYKVAIEHQEYLRGIDVPDEDQMQSEPPRYIHSTDTELEASIDAAHAALNRLENRLAMVSSPTTEVNGTDGKHNPEEERSPMTMRLRRRRQDVDALVRRIEAMTDALEI